MTHRHAFERLAAALLTTCLLAAANAASAQSLFGPEVELTRSLAKAGSSYLALDADDDGHQDLVALYPPVSGVRILRGQGDGTFAEPFDVTVGDGTPVALAVGDFDMDGRDDVAVALAGTTDQLVWIQNNGSAAPVVHTIGASFGVAEELVPADVDGDGDLDLVTLVQSGLVLSYLNVGGSFFSFPFPVTTATAQDVECADVNGDGRSDVMFKLVPGPSQPQGWKVALGAGMGAFQPEIDFLPQGLGFNGELKASDLDGDGDVDLTLYSGVIRMLEAIGPLTYAPAISYDASGYDPVVEPVLVDVDGDQLLDALYVVYGPHGPQLNLYFLWRRNLGGFSFGSAELALAYRAGQPLLVTDLTGDGVPEAIMRLGTPELELFSASGSGSGAHFVRGERVTTNPSALAESQLIDLDLDGDADIVAQTAPAGEIYWFENRGDMCFRDAERLGEAVPFGQVRGLVRGSGDFDGDGTVDLLLLRSFSISSGPQYTLDISPGEAFGSNLPPTRIYSGVGIADQVAVGDFGGDGAPDLLMSVRFGSSVRILALENVAGAFPAERIVATLPGDARARFFELNGDGLVDVVYAGPGGAAVHMNLGGGTFGPANVFQPQTFGVSLAAAFDVDEDGHTDIVARGFPEQFSWARADGQGGYLPFARLDGVNTGFLIQSADINADGISDLLTSGVAGPGAPPSVYIGLGGGAYAAPQEVFSKPGLEPVALDLQDLDGDGDIDLLIDGGGVIFSHEGNATEDAGVPPGFTCTNSAANSTGCVGSLRAFGGTSVTSTDLELFASALPAQQIGMFLGSVSSTLGTQPANSQGFLCLSGSIGRYDGPGQIASTGVSGTLRLPLNPSALENSQGQVPAIAGSYWVFQLWHRDVDGQGGATSNFTSAVGIGFTP